MYLPILYYGTCFADIFEETLPILSGHISKILIQRLRQEKFFIGLWDKSKSYGVTQPFKRFPLGRFLSMHMFELIAISSLQNLQSLQNL